MIELKREKAENCFADVQSYLYLLPRPLDEALLARLEPLGELTRKARFKRPYFSLKLSDGAVAKGVQGDAGLKVSYPETGVETAMARFEGELKRILEEEGCKY